MSVRPGRLLLARHALAAAMSGPGASDWGTPNLITKSEDFSNVVWQVFNSVTVTANAAAAPNGAVTADQLTAAGGAIRQQTFAVVSGQTYTFSMYLKAVSGTPTVPLYVFDDHAAAVLVTANVTPVTGAWTRYSITGTFPASSTTGQFGINLGTYDVYAWGAQVQFGALGPYHPRP